MRVSYPAMSPSEQTSSDVGRADRRARRTAGRGARPAAGTGAASRWPRRRSTLTANGTNSPASASCTMSAIVSPALSCASRVRAPRCGVTTTLSSSNSGDSVVGSVTNTSSAAPAMMPSRIASASACSSTMPPRATLMTRSVGLAFSSRSRSMRPVVSLVLGRWIVRKSASAITWSSDSSSTPIWRARSADTNGS